MTVTADGYGLKLLPSPQGGVRRAMLGLQYRVIDTGRRLSENAVSLHGVPYRQ